MQITHSSWGAPVIMVQLITDGFFCAFLAVAYTCSANVTFLFYFPSKCSVGLILLLSLPPLGISDSMEMLTSA